MIVWVNRVLGGLIIVTAIVVISDIVFLKRSIILANWIVLIAALLETIWFLYEFITWKRRTHRSS